jgi:ubiquinone/menaquinone biosynthesis C-methylase UbiE
MNEIKVRQQYDRLAAIYDLRWNSYITNTLLFLKDWAQISPSEIVLDVACGTGEFERLLLTDNPIQHITGVDISEKMLFVAQQKLKQYPYVSFNVASVSALPFDNNSFDVVVSASSFHYFDEPNAALLEVKRVLKPNGKVIILDWCKDYMFYRVGDFILKWFDPAYKGCYTQSEFHKLLKSAQFDIKQATKFHFGVVWGMMVVTATPLHD